MDQFNKILAVFLLLIVAVGLAIFIFSRLGLLGRIFPSTKNGDTLSKNTITTTPTPTTPSLSPTTTTAQGGLFGWISRLRGGGAEATPTPPRPTPAPQVILSLSPPPTYPTTPAVTVVPFGSTSPSSYPASGAETLLLPLAGIGLLVGKQLRRLAGLT